MSGDGIQYQTGNIAPISEAMLNKYNSLKNNSLGEYKFMIIGLVGIVADFMLVKPTIDDPDNITNSELLQYRAYKYVFTFCAAAIALNIFTKHVDKKISNVELWGYPMFKILLGLYIIFSWLTITFIDIYFLSPNDIEMSQIKEDVQTDTVTQISIAAISLAVILMATFAIPSYLPKTKGKITDWGLSSKKAGKVFGGISSVGVISYLIFLMSTKESDEISTGMYRGGVAGGLILSLALIAFAIYNREMGGNGSLSMTSGGLGVVALGLTVWLIMFYKPKDDSDEDPQDETTVASEKENFKNIGPQKELFIQDIVDSITS